MCGQGRATIDILPDDVLLHIFYFVRPEHSRGPGLSSVYWWYVLVRVAASGDPSFLRRQTFSG